MPADAYIRLDDRVPSVVNPFVSTPFKYTALAYTKMAIVGVTLFPLRLAVLIGATAIGAVTTSVLTLGADLTKPLPPLRRQAQEHHRQAQEHCHRVRHITPSVKLIFTGDSQKSTHSAS